MELARCPFPSRGPRLPFGSQTPSGHQHPATLSPGDRVTVPRNARAPPRFKQTQTVLALIPEGNSVILLGALESSELPVPERLKTAGFLMKNKQKGKSELTWKW